MIFCGVRSIDAGELTQYFPWFCNKRPRQKNKIPKVQYNLERRKPVKLFSDALDRMVGPEVDNWKNTLLWVSY